MRTISGLLEGEEHAANLPIRRRPVGDEANFRTWVQPHQRPYFRPQLAIVQFQTVTQADNSVDQKMKLQGCRSGACEADASDPNAGDSDDRAQQFHHPALFFGTSR